MLDVAAQTIGYGREGAKQRKVSKPREKPCHLIFSGAQLIMRTVIETPTFQKQAAEVWSQDEREAFIDWIAANPDAGDVIKDAEGARKVRWKRAGSGKSSGARVIYFHLVDDEVVLLIMVYAKAVRETVSAKVIKRTRRKS